MRLNAQTRRLKAIREDKSHCVHNPDPDELSHLVDRLHFSFSHGHDEAYDCFVAVGISSGIVGHVQVDMLR